MKAFLLLFGILLGNLSFAQINLPEFLIGTWQSEDGKTYEHWDKLNENCMKGYSYVKDGNEFILSEYLDICKKGKKLNYIATVIDQNGGVNVVFNCTNKSDSSFEFENHKHDFPNSIRYAKISDSKIKIDVEGDKLEGFTINMSKVTSGEENKPSISENPNYDKELADKLKGDDYGMKSYVFVILKSGTNTTTDKKYIDSCFMGHMTNMGKLVEKGELVVAGPFQKNDKTYRGLFILNVSTLEEAKAILATDPAVNAKLLDYELYGWYGSAALSEYLEASEKIWRKQF